MTKFSLSILLMLSVPVYGQEQPTSMVEMVSDTSTGTELPGVDEPSTDPPLDEQLAVSLTALEEDFSALSESLVSVERLLAEVREDVRRPSLLTKVGEDFISNTIWALLTSSDREGAVARWVTSLLGLVVVVLQLTFWIRRLSGSSHKEDTRRRPLLERLTNVGLFLFTALFVVMIGGAAITNGLEGQVYPAELSEINEKLSRLVELQKLDTLAEGLTRVELAVSSLQTQDATGAALSAATVSAADLRQLRQSVNEIQQTMASNSAATEQVRREMATDGVQALTVLLLLGLLVFLGIRLRE